MLPPDTPVVGVDEHTALVIDLKRQEGRVLGQGRVTLIRGGDETHFADGESFELHRLGLERPAGLLEALPKDVVAEAMAAMEHASEILVPDQVLALASERQEARARRDWARADGLRNQIEALGWQVQDTADGPKVLPASAAGSAAR